MSHTNKSQKFSLLDCEVTAERRTSMPHSTGAKEEGLWSSPSLSQHRAHTPADWVINDLWCGQTHRQVEQKKRSGFESVLRTLSNIVYIPASPAGFIYISCLKRMPQLYLVSPCESFLGKKRVVSDLSAEVIMQRRLCVCDVGLRRYICSWTDRIKRCSQNETELKRMVQGWRWNAAPQWRTEDAPRQNWHFLRCDMKFRQWWAPCFGFSSIQTTHQGKGGGVAYSVIFSPMTCVTSISMVTLGTPNMIMGNRLDYNIL